MVEAAELAEIFQWKTPEESRLAHEDTAARQRIGEEVADVLLYLLQVGMYITPALLGGRKDMMMANLVDLYTRQTLDWALSRVASPLCATHVKP